MKLFDSISKIFKPNKNNPEKEKVNSETKNDKDSKSEGDVYTEEEQEEIQKRLKSLGYM